MHELDGPEAYYLVQTAQQVGAAGEPPHILRPPVAHAASEAPDRPPRAQAA